MGIEIAKEIWKNIEGYDYQVSNYGRIQNKHLEIKAQFKDKRGYCKVTLYKDGKGKCYLVHRLMMAAFVGKCPEGMECCHNDSNTSNNNLSNVRYDTHPGNSLDAIIHRVKNKYFSDKRFQKTRVYGPEQRAIYKYASSPVPYNPTNRPFTIDNS